MNRILTTIAATCLALSGALQAVATELPDYYPENYEIVGSLTGINGTEGYIVVLDFKLPLDPSARVYTPTTRFETLRHLRTGMLIGISRAGKSGPVADIWVLPEGF